MGFGSGDAGADMIQSWRDSGDKTRDGEPCDAVDEFGPETPVASSASPEVMCGSAPQGDETRF
jgi:hypothetical protein